MFQREVSNAPKVSKMTLYRNIDYDYYEDDLELEAETRKLEEEQMAEYEAEEEIKELEKGKKAKELCSEKDLELFRKIHSPEDVVVGHQVKTLTEQEVLQKRKDKLVSFYGLDDLELIDEEAKKLLKKNKLKR